MGEHSCDQVNCGGAVLHDPEAVLDAALDAYIGIDLAGRVVGWNAAAELTFGYPHAVACGQRLADLIVPAGDRDASGAGLAGLLAGDTRRVVGQRLHMTACHRDGHQFPVEVSVTATDTPSGPRFHAFARDATVTVRSRRFAAVEAAVARGLIESTSSTAAAGGVVEALGRQMMWPVAELWLADEDRQLLCCAGRHIGMNRSLGEFALDEIEPGVGLPGRVYHQARAEWIPDLASDLQSTRSRAAADIGLRVAVGVPIITAGHTLGALCVYGDWAEGPEDSLITLLTGVAAQVGQYLERRRAEELAIELAHTKEEFLALVTHELRNPLTVILGTVELLADDLESLTAAEQRQRLDTITRNTHRLTVITNDLLDVAALESGRLAIRPAPADLCLLLQEATTSLAAQAAKKDLRITLELPERLPITADDVRLRQVADNLLSNAIKYTPAGGSITVTASADETNQHLTWTVTDTGIGIPPAERPRLFRRFYRASTALEQRIPGTGLGLVITRAIIECHHGSIELTDHAGPGTTFTIRLPIQPPETPTPTA